MSDTPFKFRSSQYDIISYSRGLMGVAAVPGSGKTFTLSHLAAALVQKLSNRRAAHDQEVLIVTFANAAVNSFKSRIASILEQERGLLPYTGYRVRTLHGLAHDIVRERPTLVGLAEDFRIVDDRVAYAIRRDAVIAHYPEWRERLRWILADDIEERYEKVVLNKELPDLLTDLVDRFISRAKEMQITPDELAVSLENQDALFDLSRFATAVYQDYQRSLAYRGAVDFQDLVRLALTALQGDTQFLERLQDRWPYILEDEAQDSSLLQEKMLWLLTGGKNWVRVGDPNQAINTTFTTANPQFLRNFLANPEVKDRPLNTSGRSSRKIIHLANELVRWTTDQHPVMELRTAFYPQNIEPTELGDIQANPPDATSTLYIHPFDRRLTPDDELKVVLTSLQKWLPDNPDKTVAVLVPENSRGYQLTQMLQEAGLNYEELLRSTTETRAAAGLLRSALLYLSNPRSSPLLASVYREVWVPLYFEAEELEDAEGPINQIYKALHRHKQPEDFIWPVGGDWAMALDLELPDDYHENLGAFIALMRRWLSALSLPIDQLILTIGQDLFTDATDIALTYKIAVLLRGIAQANPTWRLPDLAEELRQISENQRKFIGFDDAETGYAPKQGVITVSTMHAAKGLEWDRVYLMAVNNYSFPSALDYEEYLGEKRFIRDNLNLDAEVLAQLETLIAQQPDRYEPGPASQQARTDYAAERLRLLYVGITRAKSDLSITWNVGRFWERGGNFVKQPAFPLYHLREVINGD
ncbi:MAG: ATP-dependent helicase [Chloroflexi bacterium]|nr:ATP-dependent helicase [Chloroflexota bacterium]